MGQLTTDDIATMETSTLQLWLTQVDRFLDRFPKCRTEPEYQATVDALVGELGRRPDARSAGLV